MLKEFSGTEMYRISANGHVSVEGTSLSVNSLANKIAESQNGTETFNYTNPHKQKNDRPSLSGPQGELIRTGDDLRREGKDALLVEQEEHSGGRIWVIGTEDIKTYSVDPISHSVLVIWKGRRGRTTAKTFYPGYLRDFSFLEIEEVSGKKK